MILRLFAIALGGAFGTVMRYYVSKATYRWVDGLFPWGTLAVNLIGCFFVGFLWEIFDRYTFSPTLKLFVFIGILGGFTTFSTYALESMNLARTGELSLALLNVLASTAIGLFLVAFGLFTAKLIVK